MAHKHIELTAMGFSEVDQSDVPMPAEMVQQ